MLKDHIDKFGGSGVVSDRLEILSNITIKYNMLSNIFNDNMECPGLTLRSGFGVYDKSIDSIHENESVTSIVLRGTEYLSHLDWDRTGTHDNPDEIHKYFNELNIDLLDFSLDQLLICNFLINASEQEYNWFNKILLGNDTPNEIITKILINGLATEDVFSCCFSKYFSAINWNCYDYEINTLHEKSFEFMIDLMKYSISETEDLTKDDYIRGFNILYNLTKRSMMQFISSDREDFSKQCFIMNNYETFYDKRSPQFESLPIKTIQCLQSDFLSGINTTDVKTRYDNFSTFEPLKLDKPEYSEIYKSFKKLSSASTDDMDDEELKPDVIYVRDCILGAFVCKFTTVITEFTKGNWPLKCVSVNKYSNLWLDDSNSPFLIPNEYLKIDFMLSLLHPRDRINYLTTFIETNFPGGEDNWNEWSKKYLISSTPSNIKCKFRSSGRSRGSGGSSGRSRGSRSRGGSCGRSRFGGRQRSKKIRRF